MKTLQTIPRILTLSCTATTAMWMFSYMTLLFGGQASGEVLFVLAGLSLVLAGMINTTNGGNGIQAMWIGVISAFFNLLLLGSLVGGGGGEEVLSKGALWFGILLVGSIGLAFLGSSIARALKPCQKEFDWQYEFFVSVSLLVFLMLVTGGLVTGLEAGLAVPDWPNSYGHNMLLYPLTEMISSENDGIFFEHAHRLTGMFVGIASLVLLVCAWRWSSNKVVRAAATVVFFMVCLQGLLGGLRVTGYLTLSQDRELLNPNVWIGVVHGVVGQLIFAGFVWIAAMMSPAWKDDSTANKTNRGDVRLGWVLVCSMVLQLILGAVYRHMLGDETLAPKATHILLRSSLFVSMSLKFLCNFQSRSGTGLSRTSSTVPAVLPFPSNETPGPYNPPSAAILHESRFLRSTATAFQGPSPIIDGGPDMLFVLSETMSGVSFNQFSTSSE